MKRTSKRLITIEVPNSQVRAMSERQRDIAVKNKTGWQSLMHANRVPVFRKPSRGQMDWEPKFLMWRDPVVSDFRSELDDAQKELQDVLDWLQYHHPSESLSPLEVKQHLAGLRRILFPSARKTIGPEKLTAQEFLDRHAKKLRAKTGPKRKP